MGAQKGKKVFSLQTLPPIVDKLQGKELLGNVAEFSLHAGVSAKAYERDKIEHLCRYIIGQMLTTCSLQDSLLIHAAVDVIAIAAIAVLVKNNCLLL